MTENFEKLDAKQAELLVLTQVRKNIGNTAGLQKMAFEVTVMIKRLPDEMGKEIREQSDRLGNRQLKAQTFAIVEPVYQLRAEHELNVQQKLHELNVSIEESAKVRNELMRANYIYPNGGYTKVDFKHPVTGKVYSGEAFCNISDQFNRKKSHCRAWGRIYRQLLEDSSMGFKKGKRVVDALIG